MEKIWIERIKSGGDVVIYYHRRQIGKNICGCSGHDSRAAKKNRRQNRKRRGVM